MKDTCYISSLACFREKTTPEMCQVRPMNRSVKVRGVTVSALCQTKMCMHASKEVNYLCSSK